MGVGSGGINPLAVEPTFCFFPKSGSSSFVRKCRKSCLARAKGRRVYLRPGPSFLHIKGALWWIGFVNKLQSWTKVLEQLYSSNAI